MSVMSPRAAVAMFLAFAFPFFMSTVIRGVTGTLAPALTGEFSLSATELGLLAGGYFFGFAALQLPLGHWLDRHGPKKVLLGFLTVAVIGCVAFACASGFASLLLARVLTGIGVGACLMAPLTGYRRWLAPEMQLRANSWMLMTGSLGLLTATLPVQWALPLVGWRWVFGLLALLLALSVLGIAARVPRWESDTGPRGGGGWFAGYRTVFANAYFRRLAPLGLVNYGALVSVQTLWAGPWMTNVAGYTPVQAAGGLFAINLTMLVVYWCWGALNPRLESANLKAERIMLWGLPLSIAALAAIALAGMGAGWAAFALFCGLSSVVALSQPAVGMAFPAGEAGRALSAFNLLIFLGTFLCQWGTGVGIDLLLTRGVPTETAYRWVFGALSACCAVAYGWFALGARSSLVLATQNE